MTPWRFRPAAQWQLADRTIEFGPTPMLMGIVNATPDSFSDGGQFFEAQRAVDHALQLVADGADIIDIGGESTRPYAERVAADEELRRVIPVIERLRDQSHVTISIDTSKAEVAAEAIQAGAQIINDVTGLESDPSMLDVVVSSRAGVCAMHMQGTPQTMQDNPHYENVVEDVLRYLQHRASALQAHGIPPAAICLDFGIGFGKKTRHNVALLRSASRFHQLGYPLLVGHSRKGFLGKLIGDMEADRGAATLGVALAMASHGIQILRVHDVLSLRQALICYGELNRDAMPKDS